MHSSTLFECGSGYAFEMEYVESEPNRETLTRVIAGRTLPNQEAARILLVLARAIEYAHQQNVVHRDLKPDNVLVSRDGQLKISDFGLARLLDEAGQTTEGRVLGTPQYMAPEQAWATKGCNDRPVDLYSLGAILYEMLTGRVPFLAPTAEGIRLRVRDQKTRPILPSLINPQVDILLEAICMKCLQKRPEDRYRTAEELVVDLERFSKGESVGAPRWTRLYRAAELIWHNPVVFCLLLTLFIGTLGFGWWLAESYASERIARQTAEARGYGQSLQNGESLGRVEPDSALDLLEDPRLCPPGLRGFEWDLLVRRIGPRPRPLTGHERDANVFAVAISPDGRTLASAAADGTIILWNTDTASERLRIPGRSVVTALCYAGNDQLASAESNGRVALWDAASGTHLAYLPGTGKLAVNALAIAKDGQTLASAGNDGVIRVWNLPRRELLHSLSGPNQPLSAVTFASDGKTLLSATGLAKVQMGGMALNHATTHGSEVMSWDLAKNSSHRIGGGFAGKVSAMTHSADGKFLAIASATEVELLAAQNDFARLGRFPVSGALALAFSADERYLAIGADNDSSDTNGDPMASVRIIDTLTRVERCRLRGHPNRVHCLAFGPTTADARPLLASGGAEGSLQLRILPLGPEATVIPQPSPQPDSDDRTVAALSADGRLLIAGQEERVVVWRFENSAGKLVRHIDSPDQTIKAVALTRDGSTAATGHRDGTIHIWSIEAPELRLSVNQGSSVTALKFTPDGRLLISAGDQPTVLVWDAHSGQQVSQLTGHSGPVNCLAISTDGTRLASGGDHLAPSGKIQGGELFLWDLPARRSVRRLAAGEVEPMIALSFSPDGKSLVSGQGTDFANGSVRLWDVPAATLRRTWSVDRGALRGVAFAPDGRTLVTGNGKPSAVRFWDYQGVERLSLKGSTTDLHGFCFAEGGRLAASTREGTILVWDAQREGNDQ